jgi:hypothetical protein
MYGRYKKCYCMNNNYTNNCDDKKDTLETQCQNVVGCNDGMYNNSCGCGFDEEYSVFPDEPMLGQSYVPYQYMDKTFKPAIGLKMGTIFPELVSPYCPGQSMETINYLEATNEIGKGCNKCR